MAIDEVPIGTRIVGQRLGNITPKTVLMHYTDDPTVGRKALKGRLRGRRVGTGRTAGYYFREIEVDAEALYLDYEAANKRFVRDSSPENGRALNEAMGALVDYLDANDLTNSEWDPRTEH